MTDVSQATAPTEGVERTAEGTIVDQSPTAQSEASPPSTTPATTQPQTDGKTLLTEGKQEPAKTEAKTEAKAPEKYDEYTVPEGFTLDAEVKTQADAIFKGLNLSQEQAQSLVDFYVKQTNDSAQAPYKAWEKMQSDWRKESESHPDLSGKLGAGKDVSVRIAKFLDGIGDNKLASDFRALMDLTGAGNHQAFIRVLDYAARRMTEGSHVAGKGPSEAGQSRPGQGPPSAAAAMWPNLPSSRG